MSKLMETVFPVRKHPNIQLRCFYLGGSDLPEVSGNTEMRWSFG